MVKNYGHNPAVWHHIGGQVEGHQAGRFKFVRVGPCATWGELVRKLQARGRIPEGQWIEAVKNILGLDSNGPIGVADASWVGPDCCCHFPGIDLRGRSGFYRTDDGFHGNWRWLIEIYQRMVLAL
jgi:hypothetical protein